MSGTITIKELHDKTGAHVRRAGLSRTPIAVTDRGKLVALLVSPKSIPRKRPQRLLLPDYAALLKGPLTSDVLADLETIRGDR